VTAIVIVILLPNSIDPKVVVGYKHKLIFPLQIKWILKLKQMSLLIIAVIS